MNRIAIVDDSDINLTLLSALVRRLGDCEPLLFQESPKGLAWCTENRPDLIVVDYMMPELDGLEFIARLRQVSGREDVPILMITANDDKEVRYEALQKGATDFLSARSGASVGASIRCMIVTPVSGSWSGTIWPFANTWSAMSLPP